MAPITTICEYRERGHIVEIGRSYAGATPRDFDYWYRVDEQHRNFEGLESEGKARAKATRCIEQLENRVPG